MFVTIPVFTNFTLDYNPEKKSKTEEFRLFDTKIQSGNLQVKIHVQRVLAHLFNSLDYNNVFRFIYNMISIYTERDFEIIKQTLGHDHATSVIVQVRDVKPLVFKASLEISTD